MPTPNKNKELTAENSRFSFAVQPTFSLESTGDKKKRLFAGIAYSGEIITGHYYWGNVIFDLHSMSVPAKLPALIDHDRGQRCGYVTQSAITDATGFAVQGILLSNEHGSAVAADSDEGFPWQMSVHINPGSIEEVAPGTTVNINGRTVDGPVTVFRNSTLGEVSFTATGWDANTSAAAMSRGGDKTPSSKGDDPMDLAQALARVAALEAEATTLKASNDTATSALATANATLTKFSTDAQSAAVKQLFTDIGREYKVDAEDVKSFSNMQKDAFDMTAKMLREQSGKGNTANSNLFSHQADASAGAPGASGAVANPLMVDAQSRATQFAKR